MQIKFKFKQFFSNIHKFKQRTNASKLTRMTHVLTLQSGRFFVIYICSFFVDREYEFSTHIYSSAGEYIWQNIKTFARCFIECISNTHFLKGTFRRRCFFYLNSRATFSVQRMNKHTYSIEKNQSKITHVWYFKSYLTFQVVGIVCVFHFFILSDHICYNHLVFGTKSIDVFF